jgi:hypothetical protein
MKVRSVYINTYKGDFSLAKVCIASIRYWYPEVPIVLIKDMGAGPFDTRFVEENFGVSVLDTGGKSYGWGFGKFEPLFRKERESFLFMDADTVMTGPVLDVVKDIDADFIVDDEVLPIGKIINLYYHPEKIKDIQPDFVFPGYAFNTGQWFGTSGVLTRDDFNSLVSWNPKPSLLYPDIFKQADQGVFNFIIHRKERLGQVSVCRLPLMVWPAEKNAEFIDLRAISERRSDYPLIIHWAGMKGKAASELPRKDIIDFFRSRYYLKAGDKRRLMDAIQLTADQVESIVRRIKARFRKYR